MFYSSLIISNNEGRADTSSRLRLTAKPMRFLSIQEFMDPCFCLQWRISSQIDMLQATCYKNYKNIISTLMANLLAFFITVPTSLLCTFNRHNDAINKNAFVNFPIASFANLGGNNKAICCCLGFQETRFFHSFKFDWVFCNCIQKMTDNLAVITITNIFCTIVIGRTRVR